MKASLLAAISMIAQVALADDPLPKRPDFNRYKAMLDRSPFAVATVAVPTATPDFAKDLFVANAARSGDGLLSEPIAGACPRHRELVFMPLTGSSAQSRWLPEPVIRPPLIQ